ncbi:MAG: hypothetical protein JO112_03515, partial [Planctomycetes bacterium]|nr:hypothetical protein [Planctomycetota bacterium]
MVTEIIQFLADHGTVVILGIIVLAVVGIVQWRKARAAELDAAFKAELLERGISLADMEKLLAARGPGPKSWLEQFGALSGGAKTGLIIGIILLANFVM